MARMNVSLSEPLLQELRGLVPSRQRSAFVSRAVREKLERLKQQRAILDSAGAWSDEERNDPEVPEVDIRTLRNGWEERAQKFLHRPADNG